MNVPSVVGNLLSACVLGAFLSGCAGGGSSVTRAPGTSTAGVPLAVGSAPRGGVRRTASVPTCQGLGANAFIGGGVSNAANAAEAATLGGGDNQVCDPLSSIGGGDDNKISSGHNSAAQSFIGAGQFNVITGSAEWSFLGAGLGNEITGEYNALLGGQSNLDAGTNALLGAGESNSIAAGVTDGVIGGGSSNTLSATYGVIAGGTNNNVSGEGAYIAAGGYNTASGEGAVVDGGFNSTAGGAFATIPGGYANYATGTYSFAAGARASALQNGTFVWSDGSDGDAYLTAHAPYEFLARASGGFVLWTNAAATVGATLAPGSGTWASASDRDLKTDVVRVDDAAVLEKVAQLPIDRWSYKSERGVRHVGPMAQDFYAAFGIGPDDKHITSIDEDGVALAAIKALHAENTRLRAHEEKMQVQLDRLVATVSALRARR